MKKILDNKKNKKLLISLGLILLTLCIISMIFPISKANAINTEVITGQYEDYKPTTEGNTKFLEAAKVVLAYIQYFAVAILLATIIIAGIIAVSSTSDKKADVKGAAVGFLVGAVLVFIPVTIIRTIIGLV